MWTCIVRSVHSSFWGAWEVCLEGAVGITWPEVEEILQEKFNIVDPEVLSSSDDESS